METLENKMNSTIIHFERELNSLRTSRANPNMLDNILVDAYGSKSPISQLGNISAPDPNTLIIQVWDKTIIKPVEIAITESNLGINPQIDGQLIRLPIPKLSEEEEKILSKLHLNWQKILKLQLEILEEYIDLSKNEKDINLSEDELKKI